MALSSPGVEVKVIDESFYTPAEPGTVPLIVVATAENKSNGAGTGTAPGTLAANAGEVYLMTSQRDLVDNFGDPIFKTDVIGNPIHAGEQNEYGLQAAYSLLGVSNRAYVVRADIDLSELDATADAPTSEAASGTHWLDTKNTVWGIFEWNGNGITTTNGQTFIKKTPLVVTDETRVDTLTGGPKTSVGAIGDYAIVTTDTSATTKALTTKHGDTTENQLWYKSKGNLAASPAVTAGTWVKVGSSEWRNSHPTVSGQTAVTGSTLTGTLIINGTTINVSSSSMANLVSQINSAGLDGISAAVVNGKLEIYSEGESAVDESTAANPVLIAGTLTNSNISLSSIGVKTGTYYGPSLAVQKHTQVPEWKTSNAYPRPTGSVWVKTTEPNGGSRIRLKRWNSATKEWEAVEAPIYENGHDALYNLDASGGGANLAVGTCFSQFNHTEDKGIDSTPRLYNLQIWRKGSAAPTTVTSKKIIAGTISSGARSMTMAESDSGQASLSTAKTVSWTATGTTSDAELLATAINAAGFEHVTAEVDSSNRVLIKHALGGEIRIVDGTGTPVLDYFENPYTYEPSSTNFGLGTRFLHAAPAGDSTYDFIVSAWEPLVYAASDIAPNQIPLEGQLWYSSVTDEIDIMIHDGTTWVGYLNELPSTDPNGPLVKASEPERQSDGTSLETGDLWIDTADLENFPTIYRYNKDLLKWILLDKTDQTTENGVLFGDARYNDTGENSDKLGDIVDLLESDFLDPDAPDPSLYPKGMLLYNTRRSGFNVKAFRRNYIDTTSDNVRLPFQPSMLNFYPHRWVTVSSNQDDGSGSFGRKAQRKVVVQALQAVVNSSEGLRDEERRVFNLIACPGYPELIGELITLNYDRGLTSFVVGDTPARLSSDATSLLAWASNERLANEDNDFGATSFDEYMGMFYPWGFSSDNFGNNIVVPPSHMILRTIALNDQVAYPWFAPAGVRRGGITNATAVGYITAEGEFASVALNTGQRDTLYEQKINPITFLTGTGLVNYGQKTRARSTSALDRINVARLVVYLRRQLNQLAKPYIFEPNDKVTRDQIRSAVESLLVELVGLRAIYDYLVVCDDSNNTPSRIDRNELWIDIAIEPIKAVEFIYIPLRLKNTGEIASLG